MLNNVGLTLKRTPMHHSRDTLQLILQLLYRIVTGQMKEVEDIRETDLVESTKERQKSYVHVNGSVPSDRAASQTSQRGQQHASAETPAAVNGCLPPTMGDDSAVVGAAAAQTQSLSSTLYSQDDCDAANSTLRERVALS